MVGSAAGLEPLDVTDADKTDDAEGRAGFQIVATLDTIRLDGARMRTIETKVTVTAQRNLKPRENASFAMAVDRQRLVLERRDDLA